MRSLLLAQFAQPRSPILPGMSPLSAIAVTRLASQALTTAGRVATHSVERFADVLADVGESSMETANRASAGAPGSTPGSAASGPEAKPDDAATLGQSIVQRIRSLLAQASLPSEQAMTLELSPLGDVYLSSETPQRSSIEGALDSDSQLRELLGRWRSLTGQKSFPYNATPTGPQHSPWQPR